ncbi:ECF transporter S component [Fredinandcohnia humi]
MNKIKEDFTLMSLLLMPVAIAINTVGGQLAVVLKLPVYLDAIGTILIAMLAGPWVGALTGLLSNSVNAIFDPVFLPYALVSIAIGYVTGVLSKRNMMKGALKILVSSVIIALVASIISAPITAYMFGGVTGSGSTLITGVLLATGQNLLQAVVTTSLITDTLDKLISVVLCYFIIKSMSNRYLTKFKFGPLYSKGRNHG